MATIVDISEVLLELGLSNSATDEERAIVATAITRAEGAVKRHLRYDPVQRTRTEYYPHQDFRSAAREAVWEVNDTEAYLRHMAEAASTDLQVQHLPIRSITTLHIDYDARSGSRSGAFGVSTLKVEGEDFWPNYDGLDSSGNKICRDGIIRSAGSWPNVAGSVKLVSVAGYTAKELHGQDTIVDASPIMDAVIDEAVRRAKKAFVNKKHARVGFAAGPITSERLGDYSVSYDSASANRLFGGLYDLLPETSQTLSEFVNLGWPLAG